jgi:hypothetical protein
MIPPPTDETTETFFQIPHSRISVVLKSGVWHFYGPEGTKLEDAVAALAAQKERLMLKHSFVHRAWLGLKSQKFSSNKMERG